jgi:hypothetical protein
MCEKPGCDTLSGEMMGVWERRSLQPGLARKRA